MFKRTRNKTRIFYNLQFAEGDALFFGILQYAIHAHLKKTIRRGEAFYHARRLLLKNAGFIGEDRKIQPIAPAEKTGL